MSNAARDANDFGSYSKLNGRKNQSVTKPISLDASTGEVLVRTSTGKARVRKGQTEQEYREQLTEYFQGQKGPGRTEVGWMDHIHVNDLLASELDLSIKSERKKLAGFCHVLYYRKDYMKCAELCGKLIPRFEEVNKNNKILKEVQELTFMLERCRVKTDRT